MRSRWKGPYVDYALWKGKTQTKSRRSVILPTAVGTNYKVYNGIRWVEINVIEEIVGHKLGEFVPTRVLPKHPDKTNKKKK